MNQSIAQRVTSILSLVSGAAALLTAGAAVLGDRLFAYFFFPNGIAASSIGIIGGADGPTAIFVTTRINPKLILICWSVLLALLCAGGFAAYCLIKMKHNSNNQ